MSSLAQRKATAAHRKRTRAKGLVRVELQVPTSDKTLVREVARRLREDAPRAAILRETLRSAVAPEPEMSALDIFASDLPDEYFEGVFDHVRTTSKPIEL
jgi:hypothetical protein